ncbi:CRISPR-associated ring nuclease Crn3/Csx3 [Vacuolonema iberomarrocanum]|uniref:CRISPR-associated ring nuclease Crn3/Csx3 n=1 Tax=Vacuolonema iberomarrocanum TaxID=3454632 RepID=UPI0019E20EE5|nr:CRISPR-associated protein Csx3 [filamentous cyanobacterium LEGE 07170]
MLSTDPRPPVQLSCTTLPSAQGNLQTLAITLTDPQTLVRPACLPTLSLPTDLNLEQEVILYGRSPTWLYGYLIHRCHAAPWLGCYDARSREIVVIHSRVSTPQVGDTLAIVHAQQPCPAILIGGPPNSGKSVLSNALRLDLTAHRPQSNIFLHRASWDGEGNWAYETNQPKWVERLVQSHE